MRRPTSPIERAIFAHVALRLLLRLFLPVLPSSCTLDFLSDLLSTSFRPPFRSPVDLRSLPCCLPFALLSSPFRLFLSPSVCVPSVFLSSSCRLPFVLHLLRRSPRPWRGVFVSCRGLTWLGPGVFGCAADDVVCSVLDLFVEAEWDGAWHGGCLALAELAR